MSETERLPDWMMRCEKRRSASLLGHSGPLRTPVRFRSSFGPASHLTTFDSANEYSKKLIQSGKVLPRRASVKAPDYKVFRLKLILVVDIDDSLIY